MSRNNNRNRSKDQNLGMTNVINFTLKYHSFTIINIINYSEIVFLVVCHITVPFFLSLFFLFLFRILIYISIVRGKKQKTKTDSTTNNNSDNSDIFLSPSSSNQRFKTSSPKSSVQVPCPVFKPIIPSTPRTESACNLLQNMSVKEKIKNKGKKNGGFPLVFDQTLIDSNANSSAASMDTVSKELALFVVKLGHPVELIEETESNLIIKAIMEVRDVTVRTDPESVRILNVVSRSGFMKFICENEKTLTWLENGFKDCDRKDLIIQRTPPGAASLIRCSLRFKSIFGQGLDFEQIIKELQISNPGLSLNGAKLYKEDYFNGGQIKSIYMGIPQSSKPWLLEHEGKVQFKLQQTRILFDEIRELMNPSKPIKRTHDEN